ncbi:thioredoxin family protein [Sporosarcina ureilytica]|uniref:Thioredoxin family protein n=1 Tax=Sporosarcina ureilytica TaxID=298596 RepID=A0A1D8JHD4_9BACL|nr:thioredoxin family protein [Sporosarcina ureilytica]
MDVGLNEWFNKGLTPEQYMETLDKHKEAFNHIYESFSVENDETFLQQLNEKNVRAVVLAEPWCGHCMLNIPVLLRLSEKANMPIKFLLRDENLELMDQYLTNGKSRTIPIMIFINENGDEIAKWGPIADKTKQYVDELRKDLPPKESEEYDEKFKELIAITGKEFKENADLWNGAYISMKETLSKI